VQQISFEIDWEEETRGILTTSFHHGSDVCVHGDDVVMYLSSKGYGFQRCCFGEACMEAPK
jgi:hypothetical protein